MKILSCVLNFEVLEPIGMSWRAPDVFQDLEANRPIREIKSEMRTFVLFSTPMKISS